MAVIRHALAALAMLLTPVAAAADDYVIDPEHTSIVFKVGHWQFSRVQGRFNRISGKFSFDPAKPETSTVYVEVDIASFDTNHAARDRHMLDPTFFNVAKYPKAVFRSTKIVRTGKRTGLLTGNLTLLGVTKPVTLKVTFNGIAPHPLRNRHPKYKGVVVAGFSASTSIRRSRFGMTNAIPEKSDIAQLSIEVEGWKKR